MASNCGGNHGGFGSSWAKRSLANGALLSKTIIGKICGSAGHRRYGLATGAAQWMAVTRQDNSICMCRSISSPVRAEIMIHKTAYPPGPTNFSGPLTYRHALRLAFWPLDFFQKTAAEYGDISFFRILGIRGYFLNHPELISQVLIHESDSFKKLPRQLDVVRQIFGQGILLTDGRRWQMDRQYLQKAFDAELMSRNAKATVDASNKMLVRWDHQSTQGEPFELAREMTRLAAEISSTVFVDESDPEIIESLTDAVLFISDEFSREMNALIRLPDWMPFTQKKHKLATLQFYQRFFDQLISKRIRCEVQPDDLLGYLLRMPKPPGTNADFVRDQLLTMLVAGYHATSIALVWIFHALETNPDVEAKVIEEIDQYELLPGTERTGVRTLKYLRCTIEEVLRMYPPAWALFARQSVKAVQMRGYRIEAGGWFYIAPYITQRTAEFFPDPLTFDPLRFSDERRKDIPKHAYFPFGLGGHACIGAHVALEQLVLVTATVLQKFKVRRLVPEANPAVEAKLTIRPRNNILCRVVSRHSELLSPNC